MSRAVVDMIIHAVGRTNFYLSPGNKWPARSSDRPITQKLDLLQGSDAPRLFTKWTNARLHPIVQYRNFLDRIFLANTTRKFSHAGCRYAAGFSLLELVIVICIISGLSVIALNRLWALQVEAEKVAMEQVLGNLRSAIGIKVADFLVRNDMAGVRSLTGSNPMDRLIEVPNNYQGALSGANPDIIAAGSWYFDVPAQVLVYRVRNQGYFRGGVGKPARARFAIRVIYERSRLNGGNTNEIVGATLVSLEPYIWTDKN